MEENKYLLTMMVAKRAKQLRTGAKPLLKSKYKKPVSIALEEIKEGKVYLKETQEFEKSEEFENLEEFEKSKELFSENNL